MGYGVNRQEFIYRLTNTISVSKRITELTKEDIKEGEVRFYDSKSRNKITKLGRSSEIEKGELVINKDIDNIIARITYTRYYRDKDFNSAYNISDTTSFDNNNIIKKEPIEKAKGERLAKRARLSIVKKYTYNYSLIILLTFLI